MISFVLPVRNDFPHAIWTTYGHINSLADPDDDFEVLWMVNAPDPEFEKWVERVKRGRLCKRGFLKVFDMGEQVGVWPAIDRGFREARGDVVVWSCSHTFAWGDSVRLLVDLARREGGIVHSCGLYMNDFTTASEGRRWKIHSHGDPIFRGLRFFRLRDTPYTVATAGGNLSAVQRDEWFRLGTGVEPNLSIYGGGETYMDLKWWLLGSKVWTHPETLRFHWTYDRAWRKDEFSRKSKSVTAFQRNQLIALWCVGGDKWVQKIYGDKLRSSYVADEYEEIKELCRDSRQYILDHQVYEGLDELFEVEPWDYPKKAIPSHGRITSY